MNLQKAMQASIREIVFGMEDSLVSTLGAITGIAAGTGSTYVVILSGIVLIFVVVIHVFYEIAYTIDLRIHCLLRMIPSNDDDFP